MADFRYKVKRAEEPPQTPAGCGRMTGSEYWSYKRYAAALQVAEEFEKAFAKRAQTMLPQAWDDYNKGMELLTKAQTAVFLSFTPEERHRIQREMSGEEIRLIPCGPSRRDMDESDYLYIDRDTVNWLLQSVLKDRCAFCDLRGDDIKKCEIHKKLEKVLCHRLPVETRGGCIWSEYGGEGFRAGWNDMMKLEWSADGEADTFTDDNPEHYRRDENEDA